jgi:hypothetical protein
MRGIKRSIFSSEKPELNGAGDGVRTCDDLLGRQAKKKPGSFSS